MYHRILQLNEEDLNQRGKNSLLLQYLLIKEEEGDSHEFTLLPDVCRIPKTEHTANYELGGSTEAKTIKG